VGRDLTKYRVCLNGVAGAPLAKRGAIQTVVLALHHAGVTVDSIRGALPARKLRSVDGLLEGDDLVDAFFERYTTVERDPGRWFFDSPLPDGTETWVLSKMWGRDTGVRLDALTALDPAGSITVEAVP
jgi:hypothetical protein